MSIERRQRGKGRLAIVGAVALLGAVGFAGYQYLTSRPGEAAIALIPADAGLVITLDTNPSKEQVSAFMKIAGALKKEGLDKDIEEGMGGLLGQSELGKQVRPYLLNSFAMAMWAPAGTESKEQMAMLLAIKDPEAVSQILSTTGKRVESGGSVAYSFDKGVMSAGVVDRYLVVSSTPEVLSKIESVKRGDVGSMVSLSEYTTARSALPADANLMVFVSPSMMTKLGELGGTKATTLTRWLAMGASVREGGIQFDYRGPVDPRMKDLQGIKPINASVYRNLPEGAYGLMAYSEISRYYDAFKTSAADLVDKNEFEKGLKEFEKETGLSLEKDILPGFKGDAVLAFYPGASTVDPDVDCVLLLDDANGATPVALVEKVKAFVERTSRASGSPVTFAETKVGEARVWALDEKMAQSLRESMSGGGSQSPDDAALGIEQKPDVAPQLKDKNILVATVGNSVVIASSRAMLNRTIQAIQGGKTLADDPVFSNLIAKAGPESQGVLLVNLSMILEKIRPMLEENNKGGEIPVEDIINLFGKDAGLVFSGRTDSDVARGSAFLPLDYERVAAVIAKAKKGMAGVPEAMPEGTGTLQER